MSKRWLIVLFFVAAILRLGWIWVAPAWYDENFTLIVTRLPFDRMLAAVAGDVHPPLWYLLLWPIVQTLRATSLPAPIWVLRIPAALFSLGSMWIFYRIVETLHATSLRVRVAAMILMAVMPIQLYYAQEARMYALLEFLVLAACLAMLKKQWFWFFLACTAMLYTQYYGIFYLAALCLAGIFWHDYKYRHTVCLMGGLAGLAFLPWVIIMQSQMSTMSDNYWMQLTGPGMVLRVLFQALFMPPQNAVLQIPLMLAGFAWLTVALIYAMRRDVRATRWVAPTMLLAFLPFAFAIIFSLLWQPVLHYRPLIGVTPFLYILLAGPVDDLFFEIYLDHSERMRDFRRALFAAIFILPLLLICDGLIYTTARTNKTPPAAAELAYIQAHWQPGDIVYHFSDDSWVNTTPYNDLPNFKAPDCGPTLGGLSPATRSAIGQQIVLLSDLDYARAWVLWSDSPLAPACARSQLTDLGLDPARPLMVAASDEYVFDGLWILENK